MITTSHRVQATHGHCRFGMPVPRSDMVHLPVPARTAIPQACLHDGVPVTEVTLARCAPRYTIFLRWGVPVRITQRDERLRVATFLPGAVFCRVLSRAGAHGKMWRQVLVMQAGGSEDALQRVPGVRPGALLLLRAEGGEAVRAVTRQFSAIETEGIELTEVAPQYWRLVGHRLAAGQPPPAYTVDRHAAWRANRLLT